MAFLNNSGDIILDAVLTDLGRKRLSQGDGTFKISQFALGDDEIDYGQYNLSTGSAYQDLDILQTPILEAITDNVASIKSKLVTYSRTDLLYLPVVELNQAGLQPHFTTSSIGTYIGIVNSINDFDDVAWYCIWLGSRLVVIRQRFLSPAIFSPEAEIEATLVWYWSRVLTAHRWHSLIN